jgi:prophage regulatory protein
MKPAFQPTDMFLSPQEVANYLRVSRITIYRLRKRGEFPAAIQLSTKRVAFRLSEIDAWAADRRQVRNANSEAA